MSSFRRSAGSSDEEKMAKIPHMVDVLFFISMVNSRMIALIEAIKLGRRPPIDALESAGTGARGCVDGSGWGGFKK